MGGRGLGFLRADYLKLVLSTPHLRFNPPELPSVAHLVRSGVHKLPELAARTLPQRSQMIERTFTGPSAALRYCRILSSISALLSCDGDFFGLLGAGFASLRCAGISIGVALAAGAQLGFCRENLIV